MKYEIVFCFYLETTSSSVFAIIEWDSCSGLQF